VKATEVTTGLAESNGSLLPGLWLTACTPGSAPGPTLGNEYGKTLPFYKRRADMRDGDFQTRELMTGTAGKMSGTNGEQRNDIAGVTLVAE